MSFRLAALALAAASVVTASPCPFGQMAESGQLSESDAAKFFAARSEGAEAVQGMMDEHAAAKQKREFEDQEAFYKRQLDLGHLTLGGGLLNGALQPFTGALSKLAVPKIIPVGLTKVPDAAHPFQYATSTDVRGMCPTLNTMANHGYINRNGITTFAQAAEACQETLGFGYDTCAFLSALGLISGGDLPTGMYSIGGADSRVPNTIGPALGISHHGIFEVDSSISRIDSALGNQASFNESRWEYIESFTKPYNGLYGIEMWNDERVKTYEMSRDTNPSFQFEAKGLAVTLAERVFMFRALPNGTTEDQADARNILPFFMNEKVTFPENWFKRSTAYNLADVGADVVDLFAMNPAGTQLGKNEGLNNFIPLDTQPSFNTPADFLCFFETAILDLGDGQISPAIANNFDTFAAFFNGAMKPFFASYKCDDSSYTAPGKNANNAVPGKSAAPILVNGQYLDYTPSSPPMESE